MMYLPFFIIWTIIGFIIMKHGVRHRYHSFGDEVAVLCLTCGLIMGPFSVIFIAFTNRERREGNEKKINDCYCHYISHDKGGKRVKQIPMPLKNAAVRYRYG